MKLKRLLIILTVCLPGRIFPLILLTSGLLFLQPLHPVYAASAWDDYTAGLKAMEAGDCIAAKKHFNEAISKDPDDRRIRRGMFFDRYLPNAKLQELGTCPQETLNIPAQVVPDPIRIVLYSPASNKAEYQYENNSIEVKWQVTGGSGSVTVTVDGDPVQPDAAGVYTSTLSLDLGVNTFILSAFDREHKKAESVKLQLKRLPAPPLQIALLSPTTKNVEYPYDNTSVMARWRVINGSGQFFVTVNGKEVQTDTAGVYTAPLSLDFGENIFTLSVFDKEFNKGETSILTLTRLLPPPIRIELLNPTSTTSQYPYENEKVQLNWRIAGGGGQATVTVNGTPVTADPSGIYSLSYPLKEGKNTVELVAFDTKLGLDKSDKLSLSLIRVEPPPLTLHITNNPYTKTNKDSIYIRGKVDGIVGNGKLTINGKPVQLMRDGGFEHLNSLTQGKNSLQVRLEDGLNRVRTAQLQVMKTRDRLAGVDIGHYYALIIGNNEYLDPQIASLETPINDARAIARVLKENYGFSVKVLENATRHNIIIEFNNYRNILTENDNFLVYYAGHGVLDLEEEEGYWLPVDAKKEIDDKWIPNSTISNKMRAIKAKHVLLVADSCYSGTLAKTRDLQVRKRGSGYLKEIVKKKSRVVLTSGGEEPVADDGGKKGHSIFASAFLHEIESNEEILESADLYMNVKKYVRNAKDQVPVYSSLPKTGHELGGDFLFIRKK